MVTGSQSQSSLLRQALRANGLFSAMSGLIMVLGAGLLVQWIGAGNILFYVIIGLGLVFHAYTLYINTRTEAIAPAFAWYAIIGDMIWVMASAVILLTDAFSLSVGGKWLLLIVGDIVLLFAIVQFIGLRRQNRV